MKHVSNTTYKQRMFSKDDNGSEVVQFILPYLFVGGTILLAIINTIK